MFEHCSVFIRCNNSLKTYQPFDRISKDYTTKRSISAQSLASTLPQFDLVLFHAVIEWLAEPEAGLTAIAEKVKPDGHLSLLFYNRNAFVYTNVLKGRWRWQHILSNAFIGKGKKIF